MLVCIAVIQYNVIHNISVGDPGPSVETAMLQKKQPTMTKEDEDEYLAYCSDAMFRIHILKLRLSR